MPTSRDCPECNGFFRNNQLPKRTRLNDEKADRSVKNISVHDRLGMKPTVHNRLGPKMSSRLERMAEEMVPDEEPFRRDPEKQPMPNQKVNPQWCPSGLTRSQKRRVQRLRSWEQQEEQSTHTGGRWVRSQVWRVKPRADDDQGPESPAASVNMVFMLPSEFKALNLEETDSEEEPAAAELALDPISATFEKPKDEKCQHLKALFLKGYVDGKPMTKMLVDGGAAVNIMPYAMLRKLGTSDEDLIQTDMVLKDFEGNVSPARGALCVDLTIGSKTLPTTFFVINGKGAYNLLLGRDWIHANCCVPSTMH